MRGGEASLKIYINLWISCVRHRRQGAECGCYVTYFENINLHDRSSSSRDNERKSFEGAAEFHVAAWLLTVSESFAPFAPKLNFLRERRVRDKKAKSKIYWQELTSLCSERSERLFGKMSARHFPTFDNVKSVVKERKEALHADVKFV